MYYVLQAEKLFQYKSKSVVGLRRTLLLECGKSKQIICLKTVSQVLVYSVLSLKKFITKTIFKCLLSVQRLQMTMVPMCKVVLFLIFIHKQKTIRTNFMNWDRRRHKKRNMRPGLIIILEAFVGFQLGDGCCVISYLNWALSVWSWSMLFVKYTLLWIKRLCYLKLSSFTHTILK